MALVWQVIRLFTFHKTVKYYPTAKHKQASSFKAKQRQVIHLKKVKDNLDRSSPGPSIEETKCIEKAVAVLAVVVEVVVVMVEEKGGGEETSSSLQTPDGLAPEGLHPGTELPLSG